MVTSTYNTENTPNNNNNNNNNTKELVESNSNNKVPNETTTTTTTEQQPQEREGFVVGTWRFERCIGRGSYGVVWSATNVRSRQSGTSQEHSRVAVKVIDVSKLRNENELRAVRREAAIHKRLSTHEHITKVLEVIETKSRVYIVMELVEGGSLFDHMMTNYNNPEEGFFSDHGLPEAQCALLFWQMLSALEHCHSNYVLHRDLKLENFLISKSGNEVKLTDFGLCTPFVPETPQRHGCGSPLYIAPEVILNEKRGYDGEKADIWALGVTLYSILLNRMPFVDSRGRLVVARALAGLRGLPSWVSKPVSEVLRMLLEPNPEFRATIAQLKKHPWVQKGRLLDEKRLEAKKEAVKRNFARYSLADRLSFFSYSSSRANAGLPVLEDKKFEQSTSVLKKRRRNNSLKSSSVSFLRSMEQLFSFGLKSK